MDRENRSDSINRQPSPSIWILLRLSLVLALHCTVDYLLHMADRQAGQAVGLRCDAGLNPTAHGSGQNGRSGSWILRAKVAEMMTRKGVHLQLFCVRLRLSVTELLARRWDQKKNTKSKRRASD